MPAEVAVVVAVVVEIVVVPGHPLERELCRRNWIELPAEKRVINIPNRIIGEGKVLMPGVTCSVENASSTVQQYTGVSVENASSTGTTVLLPHLGTVLLPHLKV